MKWYQRVNIYIFFIPLCYIVGSNPIYEFLTKTGYLTSRESNNILGDFKKDGETVLITEKLKDPLLGQLKIILNEKQKTKY